MIAERLRTLMNDKGWSLQEMAEISDLPLETVRNVYYGKTADPKVSTVLKLSQAFGLTVNCFMGQCSHNAQERMLLQHYRSCGKHGKSLIELSARYEATAAKKERESLDKHMIPCLVPSGEIRKGILYDGCEVISVETAEEDAYVGILMPNNDLLPKYCKDDILLFENRFPVNGEYAAFYIGARAYIRKFIEENGQYRLKCLHNQGVDMVFKRMNEIDYIGTCIGVIRNNGDDNL